MKTMKKNLPKEMNEAEERLDVRMLKKSKAKRKHSNEAEIKAE